VFEDLREAEDEVTRLYGDWTHVTSMQGWIFQEVDFSRLGAELFLSLPMHGAMFWGCRFPGDVSDDQVRSCGAKYVMGNPAGLPFKPLRAFLYTPAELADKDAGIYEYYKRESTVASRMAYALHDFSILDAMMDYSEGKTFVAVMGGHQVKRGDPAYERLVKLGNLIANTGFVCVTGGGPGAMEATNLGAYLSAAPSAREPRRKSVDCACLLQGQGQGQGHEHEHEHDHEQGQGQRERAYTGSVGSSLDGRERTSSLLEDVFEDNGNEEAIRTALALLRVPVEGFSGEEMHNVEAARRVVARFGPPSCCSPSVGIPTWFYGHEPSNIFASYHVSNCCCMLHAACCIAALPFRLHIY
jgi:hypothetical protein